MEIRVNLLQEKLQGSAPENRVVAIKNLHEVMFTILNGFVNAKHYDSKDRALIKLFLENCASTFRQILGLKPDVHIGFFLTLFEVAFA